MSAFIRVTDSAHASVTDAAGRAVLKDAPAGAVTVEVWRPNQKGGGETASATPATLPAAGDASLSVEISLRRPLAPADAY
jgi:hypothetical protein